MILIAILIGVLILGIYLVKKSNDEYESSLLGVILIVVSAVFLFLGIISIPIERMGYIAAIERYNAFKQTLEISRKKGPLTEIERAAIQKDIIKWNQDIAQVKYYNKYFDLWIPDEVTKLEPLE